MSETIQPKATIVIFGATGDLANRKLYPSIYRLYKSGKLDEDFAVIGLARRGWDNNIIREKVEESIQGLISEGEDVSEFTSHFYYRSFDVTSTDSYNDLKDMVESLEKKNIKRVETACST